MRAPTPTLRPDEQAFLDGPVEQLCRMTDDWESSYELNDLRPDTWQFIRDQGFLGMIIPREYGGKGFSAYMHSQVIMKLSTRSAPASTLLTGAGGSPPGLPAAAGSFFSEQPAASSAAAARVRRNGFIGRKNCQVTSRRRGP